MYTATDNFYTKTTAMLQVGATSALVASAGSLCDSSVSAPAWVKIKSSAGVETVKVTGCTSGALNISATTHAHPSGACVVGFTFPRELICEMMKDCGESPCKPLSIV